MPKVRASSGTMGTMSLPISGSLSILRSMPTNAMVVDTSLPSLPSRNSLKRSSCCAAIGFERERHLDAILIVQRDAEARAKFPQLIFVELLLLMRDVLAFARFAEAIALDGARQNDRGRAFVLHGCFVSSVHLSRIVPAKAQPAQRLVRERLDKLEQARIRAKEMLPNVGSGGNHQLLVFPVHCFAHALDQQAFGVTLEDRIPLASPQNLDHVPARPSKRGFKLLNDLSVAAHGTVQALQIAVDDKNKIVELLARCQRDGPERFGFVGFAISDESPDLCVGNGLHPSVFEIAIEPRLINGHQRAQAHGNRRKLPEIRHQPRVRIRRKPAAGLQLAAKVFELLRAEAALQKRASVNAGRGVALKINRVAFEFIRTRAEEMVETHLVKRGRGSVGRNVPADIMLHAIGANDHGERIPANQAFDAPLEFLISGEKRLEARRNGVRVRRVRAERQVDAADRGVDAESLQDFRGNLRSAGFQNGIQGLKPFLNLYVFHAVRLGG